MSAEYQDNLIKCELCGNYYKSITNTHLSNKHNITTDEYKTLFPESKMISDMHNNILGIWRNSDENRHHFRELQKVAVHLEKRKESVRNAVKKPEYRANHSSVMKEVVRNNPEKFKTMFESPRGTDHIHYGKSNWQRWYEKYGKEEADYRLQEWKKSNKIPGGSKNTKIELFVKGIFDKYKINYIHQYNQISSMYNDFYLPDYNLIFEVDGDYWHANPKLYSENQLILYPGGKLVLAKDKWKKDFDRDIIIKSHGYNIIRMFESDINEVSLLELINSFDKDIVRTYEKS